MAALGGAGHLHQRGRDPRIVRPGVDTPFLLWLEMQQGIEHVSDDSGSKLYRLPRSSTDPLPAMPVPLPRPGQVAFVID